MSTCNFCNKTFLNIGNLRNHQKTAKYCLKIQCSDIENFKCEFCNKTYSQKKDLQSFILEWDTKFLT